MRSTIVYDDLVFKVKGLRVLGRPTVIAIGGFGGSGKSTLAARLKTDLEVDAEIVSGDDFSVGQQALRCDDWASIDRLRIVSQVLKPLHDGKLIRYQTYDWPHDRLDDWRTIGDVAYVLIEGIGIIHPDVLPLCDLSVWIDCPLEIANERGRLRDRDECGADHDWQWLHLWSPNDRDYFERFKPDELVDFILRPPF